MKSRTTTNVFKVFICFLVVLSISLTRNNAQATTITGTLDLHQVELQDNPPGLADWQVTTKITSIDLADDGVHVTFDKQSSWPEQPWHNDPEGSPGAIQYTLGMAENIDGKWYGSAAIQFWKGLPSAGSSPEEYTLQWFYDSRWGPLGCRTIDKDETIGFFVVAGDARDNTSGANLSVKERSDVVLVKMPVDSLPCGYTGGGSGGSGGGGTGGGTDAGAGVIPAASGANEARVMPGFRGDLAYSTATDKWLVVAEVPSGSKIDIKGQFVNEKNKPVGSQILIHAGDGIAPRIAYDSNIKKFLVVWMNGDGNAVFGQFLGDDGTLSGSSFQIHQGKGSFNRNGTLQFDSIRKKFVTTWLEYTSPTSATLAIINESGSVERDVKIAGSGTINVPTIAIGSDKYCMFWDDRTKTQMVVASINPTNGALIKESIIDDNATFAIGIAGSQLGNGFVVFYQDITGHNTEMQTLSDCKGDVENAEPVQLKDDTSSDGNMVSYNPASDTYALAIQNGPNGDNYVYVFDSSGNQVAYYAPFSAGSAGNFFPVVEPNTLSGTFSAVTSENKQTIKFNSGMGLLGLAIQPMQPISQSNKVPEEGLPSDLGELIGAIFIWSLRLIGVVVFVRFLYAGFLWFTSAGNTTRIGRAQTIMKNAALGAVILFAAYVILYSINPDFVKGSLNLAPIPTTGPSFNTAPQSGSTGTTGTTGAKDVCVHTGFCQQSTISCAYTGDNGVSDCNPGDTCQASGSGHCKATTTKSCSTDTECN